MAAGVPTYVFSHDPAASKPVATTSHTAGAIQWTLWTDGNSWAHHATVFSYAANNPVAVALTGPTGAHLTVLSVHVGNTIAATVSGSMGVGQLGDWTTTASVVGVPTIVGSVGASQLGTWTSVVSVIGQPTVTASVPGVVAVTGSVQATQATSPWVTLPGSTGATFATVASIAGTPTFQPASTGAHQGTTVASVIGQVTVTASVIGVPTVVGSVGATQQGSWQVTLAASGVVAAVHSDAAGGMLRVLVASQAGGGSTITGSVQASQVGSWLVGVQGTNGLQAGVSSFGGDGHLLRVDLVRGTLSAGADGAILDGGDASIKARVASLSGGGALFVIVASQVGGGSTVTGSVWASQANTPWLVTGSVQATQATSPWVTLPGSTGAIFSTVASVIGTVTASVIGQPTVTASVIGVPTVAGSVFATQQGSWLVTIAASGVVAGVHSDAAGGALRVYVASQAGGGSTVTGSVWASQANTPWLFTGSVGASQLGAPWTFTGSARVTPAESWTVGVVATSGTTVGALTATSHAAGPLLRVDVVQQAGSTSTESVRAIQQGSWTVTANQGGAPWLVTGSQHVTQASSPWVTLPGSTGATFLAVASVIGQPTVTASIVGIPTFQPTSTGAHQGTMVASVIGQPTVTASVIGTIAASITGTVVASVIGQPTVTASIAGTPAVVGSVAATPAGSWTVGVIATSGTTVGALTATSHAAGPLLRVDVVQQAGSTSTESVRAIQQGSWQVNVVGSVQATQATSPWVTLAGSSGATFLTVASIIGQPTVTASLIGVPTVVGSVLASQGGAPWTVVASVIGQPTVTASVVGTIAASVTGTVVASVIGIPTVTGSVVATQGGAPWTVVASVIGQPTVTASLVGVPTVIGSVLATQGGAPWTVVASVIGQPTMTASVVGVPTVIGSVTVTGSVGAVVAGSVHATVTGSVHATVIGSVGASQLGTWSMHVGNVVSVVGSVATSTAIATARLRAIATTASSVLAHPYDGATALVRSATAAGSNTVWLATDVWTGDLRGFAVLFTSSGDAQGVVRTVVTLTSSLIAEVDTPWDVGRVPHSGQTYKLLVDARNVEMATVATELSSSTATVWGTIAQYTVPQSGASGVKPWFDSLRLWDNLQTSLEVFQSSYWQGQARTLLVRGAVGFKWIVTSVPGGGRYSVWAGAS